MTMFRRFTDKKLDSLRARYRGDDLFRIWVPVLCLQEQQHAELNAVEVWSEAEEICRQLADISEHRDTEAEFLLGRLTRRHAAWLDEQGREDTPRSPQAALRTALVILTVLFTQLADAAPEAPGSAAADRNPHRVLARVLTQPHHHPFTDALLKHFARRPTDNEGCPIVLPVIDYLQPGDPLQQLDQEARLQVEQLAGEVIRLTRSIEPCLHISPEAYADIWQQLCAMPDVAELLARKQPCSAPNTWGKNWTLVANVIGILKDAGLVWGSNQQLSSKLGINVRSYLANHADYGSSHTPLTREQHRRIEAVLQKLTKNLNKTPISQG